MASSRAASTVILTPATTLTDTPYVSQELDIHRMELTLASEDVKSLQTKWKEAVLLWKVNLGLNLSYADDKLRQEIDRFETWDDLINDLKKRQGQCTKNYANTAIDLLLPYLRTLNKIFPLLVASTGMGARSKELTMIMGVIYLGITVTITSEEIFRTIRETVDALEAQLSSFDRCASTLLNYLNQASVNREIGKVVVDMFVSVIDFWTFAIKNMHLSTYNLWPDCQKRSHEAVVKVTAAVTRVDELLRRTCLEVQLNGISKSQSTGPYQSDIIDAFRPKLPRYELPPEREIFYGRNEALKSAEDHLIESNERDSLRTFSIFGLGGVGKTSLALNFAHHCRKNQRYDAIFWLEAETSISIKRSFTEIAYSLELTQPGKNDDNDNNVILVRNWLSQLSQIGKTWLLIYDNVEDSTLLAKYAEHLPATFGQMLITSRYADVATKTPGINRRIALQPFDSEESGKLFQRLRLQYRHLNRIVGDPDEAERQATAHLLGLLGGLAVGIEHMAAYIECDELSVVEFNEKYERMALQIHRDGTKGSNAPHTLTTLWAVSLQDIQTKSPDAFKLLSMLSIISPDGISLSLFDLEELEDDGELEAATTTYSSFCTDYERLEVAFSTLQHAALINRTGKRVSLHRLLQQAIWYSISQAEAQMVFDAMVKLINHAFPKSINGRPLLDKWQACEIAIQHAMALANKFMEASKKRKSRLETSPELQELMKNAVWYLFETGEYSDALQLIDQAYIMCPDKTTLVYAHLRNSAGCITFELNDLRRCKAEIEIALRIRSELLPEGDLEIANCHQNLSQIAGAQGDQDASIRWISLAEEARSKTPEPAALSLGLGHLIHGRALFNKSEFEGAKERYARAEQIFVRILGPKSQFHAHLLYAYGNLHLAQGEIAAAEQVYHRGYLMAHDLGPTHILTAALMYKLGVVHHLKRNFSEASIVLKGSLEIAEHRNLKGDRARILRRKALVILDDSLSTDAAKQAAAKLLLEAKVTRLELVDQIGFLETGQETMGYKELGEDRYYDRLVCGYYR